jgi:hypothetical protein
MRIDPPQPLWTAFLAYLLAGLLVVGLALVLPVAAVGGG